MPSEPELLQAVLAAPDEDPPRIAYAAWCETQPEPAQKARGKFIRLQIELARVADTDFSPPIRERRETTFALERQYGGVWAGQLRVQTTKVEFARGFVELVETLVATWMQAGEAWRRLAPIRHLRLKGSRAEAADLLGSTRLAGIRSLQLDDCGLIDADAARLAANPAAASLRWLSLAYNQLGFEASRALAGSPHLKGLHYVNLSGNPLDPVEQFSQDDERITGTWLPPEGAMLERWHGPIRWLHRTATTMWELVPNRFRAPA